MAIQEISEPIQRQDDSFKEIVCSNATRNFLKTKKPAVGEQPRLTTADLFSGQVSQIPNWVDIQLIEGVLMESKYLERDRFREIIPMQSSQMTRSVPKRKTQSAP